jgi:NADPH:quinone reductase-like Zn-dependent oxidoreductase
MISISGPPDPEFARQVKGPWFLPIVTRLLSLGARRQATRIGGRYSFLFMRADGGQLGQIAKLVDDGVIRPVVDRVFPFESTNEALAYVESGRAKGKVVVKMR